ncbi:DUF1499 domain-containing protein [Jiella sp. MQZ9-1]|uniref:DUF1499 domain-containing protein n=1 Tax=Jiella flava TaxID=2816857 RepID=A0A939FVL2_9HYPH|nr:DUF1499 domain-containing protein [Jiella flava]MBO0662322.1 DUF1499 domain-containing protein [Jiella flava]MCD2470849.1 DUF1499 domain-containing protein [Jiella flava]
MTVAFGNLPVCGHYEKKRLRLAGFARWLGLFAIVLVAVAFATFRMGGIEFRALAGLLLLSAALAFIALSIAIYGVTRVWFAGLQGGAKAIGAFAFALVALVPFGFAADLALDNPRANLAYTEGLEPDMVAEMISADARQMPGWQRAISAEDPPSVVTGRRYGAAAPEIYKAVRQVLADKGWPVDAVTVGDPDDQTAATDSENLGVSGTVLAPIPTARAEAEKLSEADLAGTQDSDQYRIAATARDIVLAMPSTVEIRIVQDGNETYVDARSTSQKMTIDFGQNRRFLESFFDALDTALAGQVSIAS